MMTARNSGNAAIVVVLILALAGILAYHFMPVFRAKSDAVIQEATTFSATQQQKDPVLFLEYATGQVDHAIETLQAGVIQLKARENAANRTAADNGVRKTADEALLKEAKDAYRAAQEANIWPATWHGLQFTSGQLQQRIVDLLKQQRRFEEMIGVQLNYGHELAAKISDGEKDIAEMKAHRADLAVQIETARIARAKETVLQLGNEVYEILDRCAAIKPAADGAPSLEAIRGAAGIQQQNLSDQAMFDSFMGQ